MTRSGLRKLEARPRISRGGVPARRGPRGIAATAVAAVGAAIVFAASAQAQTDLITNGQFASGLTGWTTSVSTINPANNADGTCSYNAVTAPGTETLTSTAGFPAPAPATTIALGSVSLTANGYKSCVLYQDIAIPAGTTSVRISLSSGNKLVGGLASGDTAAFIGLYPTTSVPDFNTNNAIASTRLTVAGATGVTTLTLRSTIVNVASVAGMTGATVRFAIIHAMQSPNSGSSAFIPGANDVLGIGNVHAYILIPTVTAVSPSSGTTAGGTSVTITGTNFGGVTAVKFGSTAAASFNLVSGTSITATSPAGSAGRVDITVTTPAGPSAIVTADRFTFVAAAPTVTAVSPSSGTTTGGTSVTITGTDFGGATSVTFGGVAATGVSVVNATTITATTPAGAAGTASVIVTTPAGSNTANTLYTYVAPPTITSVSPNSGPTAGGISVTLTGTSFTGTTGVTFGGAAATGVSVVNATTITATTPAGAAGTASVIVTTPGGSNAANSLYTYIASPTVTSVSPNSGLTAGGTSVTLTGTAFTGATGVTFGGAAATGVSVVNATTITATTPAGAAGTASIIVTTPGGSNAANSLYTYIAPPTVTSVSPSSGPTAGGTSVTLTGTAFAGATGVTFGGAAATGVSVVNATTITATTPAGAAGSASVIVTTPAGSNPANALYTYVASPTVTSVSPSSGPTAGGTSVTLTGTAFTGATSVTFGGVAATGVSVVTATTITATTPAGAAGLASIIVTTPSGSNAANALYTYVPPPTVTSVSPNSGPTAGGTSVTITGTTLTGATGVTFGGAAAASFTVVNATTITATVPAGAAGDASVIVTTPAGSNPANTLYLYADGVVASPTLGEWGMIGLAGMLMWYGWSSLRRHRTMGNGLIRNR